MTSLSFDPGTVAPPLGHFIDGARVETAETPIPVRRPSDSAVYGQVPDGSAETVDRAVAAATRAFATSDWATRPPRDRARVLRRWADLVDADAPGLARLEALGSTRPIKDALAWDVPFTAEGIRFFAEYADKLGGEVAATRSDQLGLLISEPYGVIGAIAPWNFPLVMASWKIAPAMAAGNAVVIKPSEMTPFSLVRLAELAVAAGVPAGILNVVQGSGAVTGDALTRHPGIGKLTFTGSTRTGIAVMEAAARSGPKPVTLELGGKSPQIVFADAADRAAVAQTVFGAFTGNAGQVCVAGSRLIAHRSVADEIVERMVGLAAQLRPGATWDGATSFPPIISTPQADRIDGLVRAALARGAEAVIGGRRLASIQDGAFYEPTILRNVAPGMEALDQEVFGPVLTVQTFEDEEEALALADHTAYGLAAGVHTADLGRAMRAVRGLKAGTVWVNRYGRTADFVIPTGGYKGSGIGKDLGRQAVEANLRHKSALIAF